MTVKTTPLEKEIQNEICEYLKQGGYFFWRNNTIPVFSRNNAGKMAFRSMGKYAMKGLPDIVLILQGHFIGIEVKREGINMLRPDQETFKKLCKVHGASYIVVHSLEDVRKFLVATICP